MNNNLFIDSSGGGSSVDETSNGFQLHFNQLDASEGNLFLANYGTNYVHHGDDIIVESIITSHVADTVSQASIELYKNGLPTTINKNNIVPSSSNNTEVVHPVSDTVADTILTEGDYIAPDFTVGGAGDSEGLMIKFIVKRYVP